MSSMATRWIVLSHRRNEPRYCYCNNVSYGQVSAMTVQILHLLILLLDGRLRSM